jgi:hypothetical protein
MYVSYDWYVLDHMSFCSDRSQVEFPFEASADSEGKHARMQ